MATKRCSDAARGRFRGPARAWRSVLVTCLVLTMSPIALARADTGQTSEEVAKEIIRIQNRADDTAAALTRLDADAYDLAGQVAASQTAVDQANAAYSTMKTSMTAIAVNRFMGGGVSEVALLGIDPVVQLQRDALSDVAIGAANANLDSFETLQKDLAIKQADLADLQQRNTDATAKLVSKQAQLADELAQLVALKGRLKDAEVKKAYDDQIAKQRAKQQKDATDAAARSAAASAKAASNANAAASNANAAASSDPSQVTLTAADSSGVAVVAPIVAGPANGTNDPPPTPTPAPPSHPAPVLIGGSWLCPVAGPNAFGRTFGDPRPGGRSHEGVDLISPFGTPLVAVVSGFAQMKQTPLGGNSVSFRGADGNGYFYAHLSSFEGGSRDVQAGDVIGYVGHTGDTSVDHLHFEIHPGGGAAIDPYDTLFAHC